MQFDKNNSDNWEIKKAKYSKLRLSMLILLNEVQIKQTNQKNKSLKDIWSLKYDNRSTYPYYHVKILLSI